MAVDIRSTANFGAYLKDRCKVIGARIKSDGTQVRRWRHKKEKEKEGSLFSLRWFPLLPPSSSSRARARALSPNAASKPPHQQGSAQNRSPVRARLGGEA